MTAALEGGEWSAACPGRTLPPGKTRYPFYRRLSGPQVRSGRAENLVTTGIRSRTVQPVVSRYTDSATRPTGNVYTDVNYLPQISFMVGELLSSDPNVNISVCRMPKLYEQNSRHLLIKTDDVLFLASSYYKRF